jgi:hypothetical protein
MTKLANNIKRRLGKGSATVVLTLLLLIVSTVVAYAIIADLSYETAVEKIDEAVFRAYNPGDATGSGTFDSFVRISDANSPEVEGYNTDGRPLEFDENTSKSFTRSYRLSNIPIVDDPDWPDVYREFQLDINQTAGNAIYSLDEVEVYLTTNPELLGYPFDGTAEKVYELDKVGEEISGDNWIKLNYILASGSGQRDMILRIPNANFLASPLGDDPECTYQGEPPAGSDCNTFVVLYSKFGENHLNDDGYEEWGVELYDLATKSGYKFHDLNADGIWQEGTEPGLEGWRIFVDINDNGSLDLGEPYDDTDSTGYYEITNIVQGEFKVREVLQAGWICSFPANCYHQEIFEPGGEYPDNNFGNYMTATKSGHKWHDLDADGAWDTGEPGLDGWTIELYDDVGNFLASTTTGAGGYYEFSGLDPGDYVVKEVCPSADWFQSFPAPTDGCGSGVHSITLESGEIEQDNHFGNFRNATKAGVKFEDLDGDGVKDVGEPGVSGWTIYLFGTDGLGNSVDMSTDTDGTGAYSFSVPPGSYTVCEAQPAGWTQSYPDNGVDCTAKEGGDGWAITLTSNETDDDNHFGNWRYATKSGYKWHDFNEDGVWDAVEPALPGWTIELWDANDLSALVASTTTDANGYYEFNQVMPGNDYAVCEVLSLGYFQTFPTAATTPAGESIFDCATALGASYGPFGYAFSPESGEEFLDNDFGNVEPQGCTYTQGYWKTHSIYGPAAHPDDGWYTTAGPYPPGAAGPDAPLFDSGLSWYVAFNTPPQGGNAWFILAHQWMAAYLNFYNGAGSGGKCRPVDQRWS